MSKEIPHWWKWQLLDKFSWWDFDYTRVCVCVCVWVSVSERERDARSAVVGLCCVVLSYKLMTSSQCRHCEDFTARSYRFDHFSLLSLSPLSLSLSVSLSLSLIFLSHIKGTEALVRPGQSGSAWYWSAEGVVVECVWSLCLQAIPFSVSQSTLPVLIYFHSTPPTHTHTHWRHWFMKKLG